MPPRHRSDEIQDLAVAQLAQVREQVGPFDQVPPGVRVHVHGQQRRGRGVRRPAEAEQSTVRFPCPTCPRTVAEWYMPTAWPLTWQYRTKYDVRRDGDDFVMTCPKCKHPHVMSDSAIFRQCLAAVLAGRDRYVLAR